MVLELVGMFISKILQMDIMFIFIIFFLLIVITLKIFQFLLKIFLMGFVFGFFPIVANLIGIPVEITFQNILLSAMIGVIISLAYFSISAGLRVVRIAFLPFRKTFEKTKNRVSSKGKNISN